MISELGRYPIQIRTTAIKYGQRPESRGSPDRHSGRGSQLPAMNALARGGVGTHRRYADGCQLRRVGGGKTIPQPCQHMRHRGGMPPDD
jgi:hypothetical protein